MPAFVHFSPCLAQFSVVVNNFSVGALSSNLWDHHSSFPTTPFPPPNQHWIGSPDCSGRCIEWYYATLLPPDTILIWQTNKTQPTYSLFDIAIQLGRPKSCDDVGVSEKCYKALLRHS